MSPWIKAGLVGAAIVVVLSLLRLIPILCVSLIPCGLSPLIYAGVGALAAYWVPPPRNAGTAAGQGALAGALAGLIGGILNTIVGTVQARYWDTSNILAAMPPESWEQMRQAGIDPSSLVGPGLFLFTGSICCLGDLVFAALLGAIGGAIFAAVKPD